MINIVYYYYSNKRNLFFRVFVIVMIILDLDEFDRKGFIDLWLSFLSLFFEVFYLIDQMRGWWWGGNWGCRQVCYCYYYYIVLYLLGYLYNQLQYITVMESIYEVRLTKIIQSFRIININGVSFWSLGYFMRDCFLILEFCRILVN